MSSCFDLFSEPLRLALDVDLLKEKREDGFGDDWVPERLSFRRYEAFFALASTIH